ncbi:hypothetical protein N7465_002481 [Penicillium sp. CMV-2018d]|nr:hypothetical protein N7465_002481 [Penicillium sp. CMV-2018d]
MYAMSCAFPPHPYDRSLFQCDTGFESVMEIKEINVGITYNAHHRVVVFQYMDDIQNEPLWKEDNPRIPSPHGDEIFYYSQVDLMKSGAAKGRSWKWLELLQIKLSRPYGDEMSELIDICIGVYAQCFWHDRRGTLGPLFLTLQIFFNGPKPNFPRYQDQLYIHISSQDLVSKSEIYLSAGKPEKSNDEALNMADTATPRSWSIKWSVIASYFGLSGIDAGEPGRGGDGSLVERPSA